MSLNIKVQKKTILDLIVKNKLKINENLFLDVFNYLSETSQIELDYLFTKKKIESSVTSVKLSWKKAARHTNHRKNFLSNCGGEYVEYSIRPIQKSVLMDIDFNSDLIYAIETGLDNIKITD